MYGLEYWNAFKEANGSKFTEETEWKPAIFYDGVTQDSITPENYKTLEIKIDEKQKLLVVTYTQEFEGKLVHREIGIFMEDVQEVHRVKVEDIVKEED